MINDLISAVSGALYRYFGDDYTYEAEEIKQGMKEPCFFISVLNPDIKRRISDRYKRNNMICVQYFPKSETEAVAECYRVAEDMIFILEVIPYEDASIRGTNIHYRVEGGVLNFFVNYDFFVTKTQNKERMETMESRTKLKG